MTRRNWIAGAVGVGGLGIAARLAARYGLVPPDSGGLYGPGETLIYATHRLLGGHSNAREFLRDQISARPFVNGRLPKSGAFRTLQAEAEKKWRLQVGGLVDRPASFSLADLRAYPSRSQITHLACEEGWSYIAEWTGVPLANVLDTVGVKAGAKYLAYFSVQEGWWDSMDLEEARHPQTLVAYGLNGGPLPVGNGGPLRMRVPRQLGYKSVKYITRVAVAESLKGFGKGLGSAGPEDGYSWYAGI